MRRVALLSVAPVVAWCAPSAIAPLQVPQGPPPNFPSDYYRTAIAAGKAVYRIDPAQSQLVVRVYRAGTLATFGHDHVVASRDLRGYVLMATAPAKSRADLYLPLASLMVDEPALRKAAGLTRPLSPAAAQATQAHMLHPVLDVEQYPYAVMQVRPTVFIDGTPQRFHLTIKLHGVRRSYEVPLRFTADARRLRVRGQLHILQSSYGIEPYTVFGGALRVADGIDLTFDVSATRTD